MKILFAAAACLLVAASPAFAADHDCAADARARAEKLLAYHYEIEGLDTLGVDGEIKALAPVRALKGDGKFDVLEIWGHVYKAEYRMRFIYAQIPGSCALMGQEILENSNPY